MVYFKYALIAIGLTLLLLFLVSIFLPREVEVERSITIDAPVEIVFEKVNTIENWEDWIYWKSIDRHTFFRFHGLDRGYRAAVSWKSDHPVVREGTLRISNSDEYELIEADLQYDGQKNQEHAYRFYFNHQNGTTRVTWVLRTEFDGNPLLNYLTLSMDNIKGDHLETGLENLKILSERAVNN